MRDEVDREGRERLADELYALRCDLSEHAERILTVAHAQRMQRRRDELEALVGRELDARLAAEDAEDVRDRITAIAQALGLPETQIYALLRLSADKPPQGLPDERLRELDDIEFVAHTLAHRLKAGRLPDVVRRPAPAYDGKSMLDMLQAGRHAELRAAVAASLDFAGGV